MRITLTLAVAFSVATGAGTYAYLDAKTTRGELRLHASIEREWDNQEIPQPEISLPSAAR
ncbi:MAG: hypothetical protein H0V17_11575 [Deltaproteobacteria bacterium]|nr:hypothetical protein [Deltaproteobacteria bacterium]